MRQKRVYLAGPDVFRADAAAWAEQKRAICARHAVIGVTPLDKLPAGVADPAWASLPEWRQIALACEAHIRFCDALVANLSPFRGPSADVGTVYEIGYARGLGRPVFGYTTARDGFERRTRDFLGVRAWADAAGVWRDEAGMVLEAFDLADNLMIDGAVAGSGMEVRRGAVGEAELAVFETCIRAVAAALADQDGRTSAATRA